MSEIMLIVCDGTRAMHHTIHGSRLDYVVAALSADPETIDELAAALGRFLPAEQTREFFANGRSGIEAAPWDAGVAIVDLAARLVVVHSSYSEPGPRGAVDMPDPENDRTVAVPYHVADDWIFSQDVDSWQAVAECRRRERLATPAIDTRAVLYGQVCPFIAQECLGHCSLASTDADAVHAAIVDIHARWLMTPRPDLAGQAPRDVLLARRNHIMWDMQDRSEQWSLLQACPLGLPPESAAYRFGGFGTHEIVVYYDMVRFLLYDCWVHLARLRSESPALPELQAEIDRLESVRERWLQTPDYENLSGHVPATVIAHERSRLPEGVPAAEAMHDADCPCCQMLADMPGPMFWNLDGSHMDDEFAFSFHATRAEWDEEHREWEEFHRRSEEEQRLQPDIVANAIWRSSYSAPDALEQSPAIALFGLAAHLAELTGDLKNAAAEQSAIDDLGRDFGNLQGVIQNPAPDLIDPVTSKICAALTRTADRFPPLAEKCADLERQLLAYARRLTGEEDVPF
jgi:hypothetical protein